MWLEVEIIFNLAQYRMAFSPGFRYGFILRYQANINTNAGTRLMATFVKQHG